MGENRRLEKGGSAPDTALKNGPCPGFKNLFNNRLKNLLSRLKYLHGK